MKKYTTGCFERNVNELMNGSGCVTIVKKKSQATYHNANIDLLRNLFLCLYFQYQVVKRGFFLGGGGLCFFIYLVFFKFIYFVFLIGGGIAVLKQVKIMLDKNKRYVKYINLKKTPILKTTATYTTSEIHLHTCTSFKDTKTCFPSSVLINIHYFVLIK